MFVIEDTTGYGVLKALKQELEKNAENATHNLKNLSPRSQAYAEARGIRGQANNTIAFILVTNVWQQGQREENELTLQQRLHWHAGSKTTEYLATQKHLLRALLQQHGIESFDAFNLAASGFQVWQCEDEGCFKEGNWLAEPKPLITP